MTGAEVRDLCLGLPGTTEKETWGDDANPGHPTFRVRDRIFVIMAVDECGGSVRTTLEDQSGLIGAFPDAARPASHVGRFGWVEVDFDGIPDDVLREVIEAAWARTAPKAAVTAWRDDR
jgi:predicted DNA-binding protein (MmcQ/YjbR family)